MLAQRDTGNLSAEEINDTEKMWIKCVQARHYLAGKGIMISSGKVNGTPITGRWDNQISCKLQ